MAFRATLIAVLAVVVAAAPLARKQLSGPASEFSNHALPMTQSAAQSSIHSSYFVDLTGATGALESSFSKTLPVDNTAFSFALFSPLETSWTVSLTDPSGAAVDLTDATTAASYPVSDSTDVTGFLYSIAPAVVGSYQLTITAPSAAVKGYALNASSEHQGYMFLTTGSDDYLLSHLQSYSLVQGQAIGLNAFMVDGAQTFVPGGALPTARVGDAIHNAELEAVMPDGTLFKTPMHDDGLHNDGAPSDGVYGGSFAAAAAGSYILQSTLAGVNAAGTFIRTVEHLVQVVPDLLSLTGAAHGSLQLLQARLNVLLSVADRSQGATVRPYVELWGTSVVTKQLVPVCWASALTEVLTVTGSSVLQLEVDLKWLVRAAVMAPFELHNVYVTEVGSSVPLSQVTRIPLTLSRDTEAAVMAAVANLERQAAGVEVAITREMREGVPPPALANQTANAEATLIMVHGYCCPKNPWLNNAEQFPGALFFFDESQSRTHDAFAQLVIQFAADNNLPAFALIGFSQGGPVSLHILNFYHTGLDSQRSVPGKRAIQSLCSPFLGSTLSGNAAAIGKIFGSCGSNYDMSLDGAALWKVGITQDSWAQTNFYYTQYGAVALKKNCNALTNLLTSLVNDGVVEINYAIPPGGNNRGLTVGQCHTDSMTYPAAFRDTARNADLFANAAI